MLHTRWNEEQVARREPVPPAAVSEQSGPLDDDVDLISCVRCLRIMLPGRVNLDRQGTVAEDFDESLAEGTGESTQAVSNGELVFCQGGAPI